MLTFVLQGIGVKPLGNILFYWLSSHHFHLNSPADYPLTSTPSNAPYKIGRRIAAIRYIVQRQILHN